MAVDQGGLNYKITVENKFSTNLQKFKTEADAASSSWRNFKRSFTGLTQQARSVERSINRVQTSVNRLSRALTRFNQLQGANTGVARLAEAMERLAVAQAKASVTGRRAAEAASEVNRDARAAARSVDAQARATARVASASRRASGNVRRLGNETQKAGTKSKGLLFTFRRLVGALALFQGARLVLNFFTDFVRKTVEFSSTIENARLGLAALFTTVGQVTGAQGELLKGTDALNAALRVSDDQLRKLRIEGLQTAATFDQLAETFQVGVGPGLAAGLDLDQIRKFTVQVSQAASALGVEQNQLSEEIRSVLSGTIQQRTTRLAAALGITNEDIRRAKEAGDLFGFLQKKFNGFSIAGEKALDTFSARATNALDALLLLSSVGGAGAFDQLKDALGDIAKGAVEIDASTQSLAVNAGALRVFQELFANVADSIQTFRDLRTLIPVEQLQRVSAVIGQLTNLLAATLGVAIRGIVAGVSDLSQIFSVILLTLQGVVGLVTNIGGDMGVTADETGRFLAFLVRALTVLGGLKLAFQTVALLVTTAVGPILVIVASLLVVKTLADDVVKALTGLNEVDYSAGFLILKRELADTAKGFGLQMLAALKAAAIAAADLAASSAPSTFFNKGAARRKLALDAAQIAADLASDLTKIEKAKQKFIEEIRAEAQKPEGEKPGETEGAEALSNLKAQTEGFGKLFADAFDQALSKIKNLIPSIEGAGDALASVAGNASKLTKALEESARAADKIGKATQRLNDQLLSAQEKNASLRAQLTGGDNSEALQASIKLRFESERQRIAQEKIAEKIREQLAIRRQAAGQNEALTEAANKQLEALNEQATVLGERNRLTSENIKLEAQLSQEVAEQSRIRSQLTGNNSGGETGFGQAAFARTQQQAGDFSSAMKTIGEQIFEGLALSEEETGEAINSYGDFFDGVAGLIEDFIRRITLQQAGLALIKALLGGGGFSATGAGNPNSIQSGGGNTGGDSTGFARGGLVRGGRGRPMLAHRLARGFADGGGPPPGVASSDTVAAWLTPGEVVQSLPAVSTYGRDFMLALNQRLIDPMGARALMGAAPRPRRSPRMPKRGYAEGGEVAAAGSGGSGVAPGVAIVQNDRQSTERMLRGGKPAMLRFLRENGFVQR